MLRLLSIVFLLTAVSIPAIAQWQLVHQFDQNVAVLRFIDPMTGFAGTGAVVGNPAEPCNIYKTTDGGQNWVKSAVPPFVQGGVMDIFMSSSVKGWAAISSPGFNTVWRTTDGGLTWENAGNVRGYGFSMYETPAAIMQTNFDGNLYLSRDGGTSFSAMSISTPHDALVGIDFLDDKRGAMTSYRAGGKWLYTGDGGLNWSATEQSLECWSVHAIPGTSSFITAPEGNSNGPAQQSPVMRSDDYGKTWQKITDLSVRTAGHIDGANGLLYVQTSRYQCSSCTGVKGFYRSSDLGATWQSIDGPESTGDQRFAVVPNGVCGGTRIFAMDIEGGVYRFDDGGGSSGYTYAHGNPAKTLRPGDEYDVLVGATFGGVTVEDIVPVTIVLDLEYDRNVIDVPTSANIIPESGWQLESQTSITGGIRITLKSTTSLPMEKNMDFAHVIYRVAPNASGGTPIRLVHATVHTVNETIGFCTDGEGNYVGAVSVNTSSVSSPAISQFSLQPNPAKDLVRVAFNETVPEGSLAVVDMLGRTIFVQQIKAGASYQELNLDRLVSGTYYVRFEHRYGVETLKLEVK